MTQTPLATAAYIDDDALLLDLIPVLAREPLLAIDTESNSMYAYRERVCLVQISTRSADYIIDPLRIGDMSLFAPLLANPDIEKVFHAAEYDLMCLKRDYGFSVSSIFDTHLAARIVGRTQVGLSNLLEELLGVQLNKRHQRDDWGERPLSQGSLLYAQMDTHYLPVLRDALYQELLQAGRMDEAREAFGELHHVPAAEYRFDPDGYWRLGVSNGLSRRQMGILRQLYLTRERIAQQLDRPPFKVIDNTAMVAIALECPRSRDRLARVKGVSSMIVRRFGSEVLQAVENGLKGKPPDPPAQEPPAHPLIMDRYTALLDWRKGRAEQRGVDSNVIISKNVLWVLAEQAPQGLDGMQNIPGLGPWRLSTYGHELLEILHRF